MKRIVWPVGILLLTLTLAGSPLAQQILGGVDSVALQLIPTTYDRPIDPSIFLIRPGEEIRVTFLNSSLPYLNLEVSPDGQIVHAVLGAIDVKGQTLVQVREKLTELLRSRYNVDVMIISVKAPRSVGISVTGAVNHPGFYRAYSSQRVSDIIALAGGISPHGSTRRIRFIGGPKPIEVDIDRALYLGDETGNPFLYAGYTVEVPARTREVIQVIGEVLHPRTIELMPNDDFSALLALAGGMTRRADTSRAHLLAGINGENRQLNSFKAGDIIRIPSRNDERTNTVLIIGEVTTPGRFVFQPEMTIGKLLEMAGGGTEKANLSRVTIFRLAETDEGIDDLGDRYPIEAGAADLTNTPVKPLDSIFVPRMVGWVRVTGAVRSPGMLPYMAGKDASYYISAAGGYLPEADARNIKIFDRISHVRISVSVNARVQDGDEIVVESVDKGQP